MMHGRKQLQEAGASKRLPDHWDEACESSQTFDLRWHQRCTDCLSIVAIFDETKGAEGLQSLRHYRYDVDPDTKQFSERPLHDHHSHAADAFRYFAVAIEEDRPAASARGVRMTGWRA